VIEFLLWVLGDALLVASREEQVARWTKEWSVSPGVDMSNPFSDFLEFLQKSTIHGRFPIYAFVLLLIASCVIAFSTSNEMLNSER
jgi:hypothetical protein